MRTLTTVIVFVLGLLSTAMCLLFPIFASDACRGGDACSTVTGVLALASPLVNLVLIVLAVRAVWEGPAWRAVVCGLGAVGLFAGVGAVAESVV